MRICIVYRIIKDYDQNIEIFNKLKFFSEELKNSNHNVDYFTSTKSKFNKNDNEELIPRGLFSLNKVTNKLFWFYDFFYNVDISSYHLIIIRNVPIAFNQEKFYRLIKKKYPNIIIVIDLPTFPFLYEFTGLKKILATKFMPKNLIGIVSYILHLGPERLIWGVPTLKMNNAIDFKKHEIKKIPRLNGNVLNLILISTLWQWLNAESLIYAINNYQNKSQNQLCLKLHIIGDGSEFYILKNIVSDLNLDKVIFFYGRKYGKELNELIDIAHVGVGNIGLKYQHSINYCQSLKHRLFACKGLPFFYNVFDEAFENSFESFYFQEREINEFVLQRIVEWYQNQILPHYLQNSINLRNKAIEELSFFINEKSINLITSSVK